MTKFPKIISAKRLRRPLVGRARPPGKLTGVSQGKSDTYAQPRYSCAVATIQIREVPEDAYEVIRKRARSEGRSIQSYMRDWVIDFAAHPTAQEVMVALEAVLANHDTPGATRESIQADLTADRR